MTSINEIARLAGLAAEYYTITFSDADGNDIPTEESSMAKSDDPRASRPRAARTTAAERRAKAAEAIRQRSEARSASARKGVETKRRNRQGEPRPKPVDAMSNLEESLKRAVEAGVRAANAGTTVYHLPGTYQFSGSQIGERAEPPRRDYSHDEPSPDYARSDMNPGELAVGEQGQIQGALDSLMYQADRLESVVANLHEKLTPILGPSSSPVPTEDTSDHPVSVVNAIENVTLRVRNAANHVVEITDRTAL